MLRRALVALLLAVPLVSTGGTAQAASSCAADQVTVVVQYLGGARVTRCTNGDPGTGIDALTSAGFTYQYSPREPGFVCTINGNPGNRDCMKPKYWSYWHASSPTGPWTYGKEGAGTYDPAPGSVEGWRFDCGAAPGGASKCAASSPKPSPKPAPAPTPSARPTAGSSAQAGSGASPSATAKAKKAAAQAETRAKQAKKQNATKADKAKKQAAAAVASASATPSPDTDTDTGTNTDVANASASQSAPPASEPARGGNLPWWWGVVALVLIGGTAGAVTAVRRR